MEVDALVDDAFLSGRDVFQIDRRTVYLADDEMVVLIRFGQLALRLKQECAVRAVELPGAGVSRAVANGADQIVEREVACRHLRRIGLDAHSRLRAIYGNLADARQNADALADLRAGVIPELTFGDAVAAEADVDQRLIVRICLGKCWGRGKVHGQLRFCARDSSLHIRRGGVHILRERKLQDEAGGALPAARGHKFKAGDLHELALERRGHVVSHGFGRGAGIADADLDYGVVHCRQVIYRQREIREHAKENDRCGQNDRHHRAANKWFGKIHDYWPSAAPDAPAADGGGATITLPPGIIVNCPVSTTRSPAATPLVTTTSSPWRCPSVT